MPEDKVTTPVTEESGEDFAAMLASQEQSQVRVQVGQKVTGTIIDITEDSVFVNVGTKIDGVMERKDFIDNEGNLSVSIGDKVEAWVTKASSAEIVLARSMSGAGMAAIESAKDAGVPVDGRVTEQCKGGYHVEVLGKTAFCPGSQMAAGDANAMVGRTLQFLITRVENRGRNIVVSHRALVEREHEANLEKLLEQVKEGDIVSGKVTRLAAFGAFVELAENIEGMVHLSELGWGRVAKAEDAVAVGDTVSVKVLKIAKEKGRDGRERTRISLSVKAALGSPWENVDQDKLFTGAVFDGRVVRLAPFGAFVEVLPGIEGLVHVSEMSWKRRVNKPEDVVKVGDIVKVKVKDVVLEQRRVSLSMRDAEGDPWADVATRFPVGQEVNGIVESRSKFGLFVTLADGVTGLLPDGIIRATKTVEQFQKLDKGAEISLEIQNVDQEKRRITLAPKGVEIPAPAPKREKKEERSGEGKPAREGGRRERRNNEERGEKEDTSWRQHQKSGGSSADMGIMAQALQKAFQNKK